MSVVPECLYLPTINFCIDFSPAKFGDTDPIIETDSDSFIILEPCSVKENTGGIT